MTSTHANFYRGPFFREYCKVQDACAAVVSAPRLRILTYLADHGPSTVTAIFTDLGMAQATVSHHLALLRRAKLVTGQRTGRERVYRLCDDAYEVSADGQHAFSLLDGNISLIFDRKATPS